jgi:hypothetical protein
MSVQVGSNPVSPSTLPESLTAEVVPAYRRIQKLQLPIYATADYSLLRRVNESGLLVSLTTTRFGE